MNTEDLRAALSEHADRLEDSPHARISPVHRRVAATRRRRAAGAAGVLVVALVVAGAGFLPGLLSSRQTQPADRHAPARLAGRAVPTTQTATGFTYRYWHGYQSTPGAKRLEVSVPVGDRPKLVMWASSDTTTAPVVRLSQSDDNSDEAQLSAAGGFDRYTQIYGRGDGKTHQVHLRLSQRGADAQTRLALAVFDLPDPDAAGVGNGAVVFRRQVAGESLIKAEIGKRGQSDLSFRVKVPSTDLSWAYTCYHTKRLLSLSVDGSPLLDSSCHQQPDLDAGVGSATFDGDVFPAGTKAGDTVTVRVHLSRDSQHTDTVAQDNDVVLGLGLYTHSAPSTRVAGVEMPRLTEYDGHDWESDGLTYRATSHRLQVDLTRSDRPRLVTWAAQGLSHAGNRLVLSVREPGQPRRVVDQTSSASNGEVGGSGYVVQPGQTPTVIVSVPQGATSRTRLGLEIYDQQP